ncbi:MAG: hypothetical protein M3341_04690 [Actinomycetota bacterium]|nr:hypothetical protein [Actinomycetota bacterium]
MSVMVRDVARQAANVVGAVFQVAVPVVTGPAVGRVSGENPTLVVPGDYAFVIWTPIFLLALVYAVYQALPSNRENPLLRRVGWFSALTYFSNGVWEILFPAREFVLSQVVFVGITGGAIAAFVLVQRGAGWGGWFDRWLVAPAFGLLAGWVTAAFFVGLVTVLVATGALNGGVGEALFGALMLIVGGAVACAVVLAGRTGPAQGYLAYGGPCCGPWRGWSPTSTRTPSSRPPPPSSAPWSSRRSSSSRCAGRGPPEAPDSLRGRG